MNVQVGTPAHVADVVATAGQNNHVHTVTGGSTTNIVNQQKIRKKKKMMTDDIVTRLGDDGCYEMSCNIMRGEAADEIERLRTQVRALEAEVSRLERVASNG